MRVPRPSPTLIAIAMTGAAAVLAGALAFGPIVRAQASLEASRRRLHVSIGSVGPSWGGVSLCRVDVGLDGVDGVMVHVDRLRVALGWTLRPNAFDVDGGVITLAGAESTLRASLERWRQLGAERARVRTQHAPLPWTIRDLKILWEGGQAAAPRLEVAGINAQSADSETQVQIAEAKAHSGPWSFSASNGRATLDLSGVVHRFRAGAVVAQWSAPAETPGESDISLADAKAREPVALVAAVSAPPGPAAPGRGQVATGSVAGPNAPFFPLPDLGALHTRVATLGALLSDRIAPGAVLGIDALTWKVVRPGDSLRSELTLGPGPLSASRSTEGVEVRFSTDPTAATTPLAVHLSLPANGSEPSISLDGGPVSLSMLGVREGTAGLVDVNGTSVAGQARAVLAEDGSGLAFEGEIGTRRISIDSARLAPDIVRNLDLNFHARGALTSQGELRVDDFAAAVGAATIEAAGRVAQRDNHVVGSLRFEAPQVSCQSLMDSLPAGLLPDLQGTKITGTFEAHGHFAFDSRALDSLDLDYDVADHCRLFDVPPWLSRDQFEHSFVYRVYLPDGSIGEQTSGPETSNWTSIEDISPYMQVAVLTTEDGAFPRHHGFNRASIRASLIANLKARRFVRGASTITMQLAKNLFLSRDKTLSRKLEEVVLTEYLEQTFSKNELMELYLNIIEFGPAVYGITAAADHYFGRTPAELNLAECLFLSSVLPAPRRYGAMRERGAVPEGWMRTLHTLMAIAHKSGRITDAEFAEGEAEPVLFWTGGDRPVPRAAVQTRPSLEGDDSQDVTTVPLDDTVPDPP